MRDEYDDFVAQDASARFDDNHLVPMINVVFLMLIFFMVAGKVSQQESIVVEPPEAMSEDVIDGKSHVWVISKTGEMQLNGMAIQQVKDFNLQDYHVAPQDKILLKMDASLSASELDPVLDVLRQHNVRDIEIAVRRQL